MMKKSKILVNINNLEEITKYQENGITHFLFALEGFSIGYKAFKLEDIPISSYLLLNRLLDSIEIDKLKSMKEELLKYQGIIFEDLGVYNIFKEDDIELIWFQNHFGTNTKTINYYLDKGVKSTILSNEMTKDEIIDIVSNSHKPIVLNVIGQNQIMYSRRKLITNYNHFFNLPEINDINIYEQNTNNNFFLRENEYGTVAFNNEPFNYLSIVDEIDDQKILYYLILNINENMDILKILSEIHYGDDGFLNKKTVYKLKDYDN